MKNLLKWLMPAIIGIVSAMGMDDATLEANRQYLFRPNTIYSINNYLSDRQIASVQVTTEDGNSKPILVKAIFQENAELENRWEDNIIKKVCQKKGSILDMFTLNAISEYKLPQEFPLVEVLPATKVTLIDDKEWTQSYNPLGKLAKVSEIQSYKRPDGTIREAKNVSEIMAKAIATGIEITDPNEALKLEIGTTLSVYYLRHLFGDTFSSFHEGINPVAYTLTVAVGWNQKQAWEKQGQRTEKVGLHRKETTYYTTALYDLRDYYKKLEISFPNQKEIVEYLVEHHPPLYLYYSDRESKDGEKKRTGRIDSESKNDDGKIKGYREVIEFSYPKPKSEEKKS